jgi:iron complex transport system permease protein
MKTWKRPCIPTTTNPHTGLILLGLAALVLVAAVLSLCLGAVDLTPAEVCSALASLLTGQSPTTAAERIVLLARLPRTCGCLLAGVALAVSGAMIQSVLSNPLAAPNIIGVNSGAGLMVALSCALFPKATAYVPLMAFVGALAGVLLVLLIAERTGAAKITLVLAGVAVSSMFSAGIDAIVTFFPQALNGYSDFRIGGFSGLSMTKLRPAFWVILVALVLAFSLADEMDVLTLGSDTARSLGLPVKQYRLALLAIAAALSGAAVSFCGLLGFVGLIVPHMMRRLVGEESRPLLAACALGGAALLTLCDLLARTLFAPYELPVGIVLSLAGGPFFIWLLLGQRGGRLS